MRRTMLDTAMRLMQSGLIPSVSDVAEAAEVSRTTAYRYFPSQAALIQAAVDEALGPILQWNSDSGDAEERVADLLAFAYPRMHKYEATLRAALWLALDQWNRRQAGTLESEAPILRGHRKALLHLALRPLRREMDRRPLERATQALSLIFGTEAFVVLKDIWRLDNNQVLRVAMWAAHAIVRTAVAEAEAGPAIRGTVKPNAAARPRRTRKGNGITNK
jgi:AcrR family transcriptional regulator